MRYYSWLSNRIGRFAANSSGATAVEYDLIAAGVAIAMAGSVHLLGNEIGVFFGDLRVALAGM